MPPIKSINLDNGLEIITSGSLTNFSQTTIEIEGRLAGVSGNLKKKEEKFNEWLNQQPPFIERKPLSNFPPDDPVRNGQLSSTESIDGADLVIRKMYGAIHILGTNPLKIIPKFQNPELGPITGEWW